MRDCALSSYFSDRGMSKCVTRTPHPHEHRAGLPEGPARRAGAGGIFCSPLSPLARRIGNPISDSGPETRPYPQARRSSWSSGSSGGDQQAGAHRIPRPRPLPVAPGEVLEVAAGLCHPWGTVSTQLCPPAPAGGFGKGWRQDRRCGSPPDAVGQGSSPAFSIAPGARWDVVFPGLFSGALINCFLFPSPSPQLQGNGVKTRLSLRRDGHTLGWPDRSNVLLL